MQFVPVNSPLKEYLGVHSSSNQQSQNSPWTKICIIQTHLPTTCFTKWCITSYQFIVSSCNKHQNTCHSMDLIRIDVSKQKWRCQCGDFCKFCMGDHLGNFFEWAYLNKESRQRAQTNRYGDLIIERIVIYCNFENHPITTCMCSLHFLVTVPVGLSSLPAFFAEIKIFPNGHPYKIYESPHTNASIFGQWHQCG